MRCYNGYQGNKKNYHELQLLPAKKTGKKNRVLNTGNLLAPRHEDIEDLNIPRTKMEIKSVTKTLSVRKTQGQMSSLMIFTKLLEKDKFKIFSNCSKQLKGSGSFPVPSLRTVSL